MKLIGKYFEYFRDRERASKDDDSLLFFTLKGGRRSGKSVAVAQKILIDSWNNKLITNVATMTQEQGRLGSYSDFCNIVNGDPAFSDFYEIMRSPRELRGKNGSTIFFNSYQNPESAKGVACDYLFVNEANNFTKQQFVDLLANVRIGTFSDFNPNIFFWIDDFVKEVDILHTTWKDNPFLTPQQLAYFEELKRLGTSPEASPIDVRNYEVYYLGLYSEITGELFTSKNIRFVQPDTIPIADLYNFCINGDPSDMCGGDYFALTLTAAFQGEVYLIDSFSSNRDDKKVVMDKIVEWQQSYPVRSTWVETNGIIGRDFYQRLINANIECDYWFSRNDKYDRILANYDRLSYKTRYMDTEANRSFVSQIYMFKKGCANDDNIDCLNSAILAHLNHFQDIE